MIDDASLDNLFLLSDAESIVPDLIAIFAVEARSLVDQAGSAIEAGDADGTAYLAHTLKGAASLVGAACVARQAAALEAVARQADRATLFTVHEHLCAVLIATETELRRRVRARIEGSARL